MPCSPAAAGGHPRAAVTAPTTPAARIGTLRCRLAAIPPYAEVANQPLSRLRQQLELELAAMLAAGDRLSRMRSDRGGS